MSAPKVVVKSFGTGQITLPKKWRDQFSTQFFEVSIQKDKLIIVPLQSTIEEEVIFDADKYNNGKGVKINEFYKALKNSLQDE